MTAPVAHVPVMLAEMLDALAPRAVRSDRSGRRVGNKVGRRPDPFGIPRVRLAYVGGKLHRRANPGGCRLASATGTEGS